MKILLFFIFLFSFQFFLVFSEKTRDVKLEDIGDDYSDFSNQEVKNGGANHNLKQVSYSTIAPKLEIPTRPPPVFNKKKIQNKEIKTQNVQPYQYRRGYFFQHYPWDQLPRRYLLRPGMTYVYPQQYQYANYKYPFLPTNYNDPYNIYKSHPGIGGGCGGGYGGSGCGGGYQQGGGGYGGGCGGSGRGACGGGDSEEDSYEDDEEDERSGEAKINKKDPLEDLELEDLEKISKSSDDEIPTSKTKSLSENFDSSEIVPAKSGKLRGNSEDDDDLIDDRKKKFLIKWA